MKICIVSHHDYGALTGENHGHIGGVERQTALLSQWLTQQGHTVSIITWDEGGDKIEFINGIEIIKLCSVKDGLPSLRFFHPRWTSLLSALKQADAEVYYHNCAEYFTGQIALWCKMNKRAFIYSVASDADCQLSPQKSWSLRDKYFFQFGLKLANEIICQTYSQKIMLANNFNLAANVIPMPGTPPIGQANKQTQFEQQKIIWVGRVQTVKRLEWFIDIAIALPQYHFEVIGPMDHNRDYVDSILPRTNDVKNLQFKGKLNREQMVDVYKNASLLCSTSIYEGFPNTYLEAWSYGLPLVCTVDPDDIVNNHELGYSSKHKQELISAIVKLLSDSKQWHKCAKNSFNYYQSHHEMNAVQTRFENTFLKYADMNNIQDHFNKQSKSWSDYYTLPAQSISQLDLQVRTHIASQYIKKNSFEKFLVFIYKFIIIKSTII